MSPHNVHPTLEEPPEKQPSQDERNPLDRLAQVIGRASRFPGDVYGHGAGERAALARMDPGAMRADQIAALSRALVHADLDPEQWRPGTWRRWALIAHGMALAGHDGKGALGAQLWNAGISESRVTKLLTARGEAFRQVIGPLLRLIASKEASPNWNELGALILNEGRDEERAEAIRMKIASRYFSALAKSAND